MPWRDWKVVRILAGVALKLWAASFGALLVCLLLWCFYGGIFAFVLLLVAISGILYHAQDNILYHPDLPPHSRVFVPVPSQFSLPYESVQIKNADKVQFHAFWIRHPGEKGRFVPTVVYFHGNAGNAGHRLQNASGIYHYLSCNVLMVEYRGYGLSTGHPCERGLFSDAKKAIDYLHSRHDLDHSQIILFGRSLGGAVAIDLAADAVYGSQIFAIIVENTFTSIPDMAVELVSPSVKYLPRICYKNKYFSIDKIQFLSSPILFISGLADNLVPPNHTLRLYNKCGSTVKRLFQIAGGSHNDTWAMTGYYQGIAKFLTEIKDIKGPLQKPPVSNNKWPKIEEV